MPKLNIIVPMAGRGSRFSESGYALPKPLILVMGKTMVERAVENITEGVEAHLVFICANADCECRPMLIDTLERLVAGSGSVVRLKERPTSPMDSFLAGISALTGNDSVLSINCDQYVTVSGGELLKLFRATGADVAAFVMRAQGASFARVEMSADTGRITRLHGKRAEESLPALTGLYAFRTPAVAEHLARTALNRKGGGEVCISESLSCALAEGMSVAGISLGNEGGICSILGDPVSLERFITLNKPMKS